MVLPPDQVERFYRIWFPLLRYVNEQLRLVPDLPAATADDPVPIEHALALRNALWADDGLRQRFMRVNPEGLPPPDLALVDSWRHRVAGDFFIERHLKAYSVFIDTKSPPHAYGVLGLASAIEDFTGPKLPAYVKAVLLPFEGRIVYDSLLETYSIQFGPGYRRSLKDAYRETHEREGIITTLDPKAASPGSATRRAAVRRGTDRVLAAFRRELARAGLSAHTTDQHVATVAAFAHDYLMQQKPPRGLLDLRLDDLDAYLTGGGMAVNRVSFRRFVRFLRDTGRLDDYRAANELLDYLRDA
jgi:hypothetical protein